jgi:hypothetical protein
MLRKSVLVCILFVCLCPAAFTQTTVVPLILEKGFPIQVVIPEKLNLKQNQPISATVVEAVYAFDREVIPAGTKVEGRITGFEKLGKWKKIQAMLYGNFTPQRNPAITFDALVLSDGTRISIETTVLPGAEKLAGSSRISGIDPVNSYVPTIQKPEKERLKNILWGISPFRPLTLPKGTRLSVEVSQPLDFGTAEFETSALELIGSDLSADSIISVRLISPLNSRTTYVGAPVDTILTRPMFSSDGRLIFPAGSRLHGSVTEVTAASKMHHNATLTFAFATIEPPESWSSDGLQVQAVDGRLVNVGVTHDMQNLAVTPSGGTKIVESKKRFLSLGWSGIKAGTAIGNTSDSFGTALLSASRGRLLKQFTGATDSGFGLPASITGAMVPPVGIGIGFFGLGRSLVTNSLGRGRDIVLRENTTMQIRLDRHTDQE